MVLSFSGVDVDPKDNYSSSEEEVETVQEKKLRLAKKYLEQLESEGTGVKNCYILFIMSVELGALGERTPTCILVWHVEG